MGFLFANDCALNVGSEAGKQVSVYKSPTASTKFGLTISTKKTEVLYQSSPGKKYVEPNIIEGQRLNVANRFAYLGSTLSQNATIDDKINVRIAKPSASFGRLHANI